jgi:hypothetical protein
MAAFDGGFRNGSRSSEAPQMESLDFSAAWLSLAWIALAFGAGWLLNVLAERDSANSLPDRPVPRDDRKETAPTAHIPAE